MFVSLLGFEHFKQLNSVRVEYTHTLRVLLGGRKLDLATSQNAIYYLCYFCFFILTQQIMQQF